MISKLLGKSSYQQWQLKYSKQSLSHIKSSKLLSTGRGPTVEVK